MKQPLVLLHGWGVNASIWDRILPKLEPEFDLTIIDLPGYGSSVDYHDDYSLETVANVVLSHAPAKANWVAWSLGGTIAMEAARTSPGRFLKLQLISATPRFLKNDSWEHGAEPHTLKKFADDFSADHAKAISKFLTLQTHSNDRTAARDNLRLARVLAKQQLLSPPPTPRTFHEGLKILTDTDLRNCLRDIVVPTQIISGSDDQVVPVSASKYLSDELPNCHWFNEFECGHLPFIQKSSEYIEALRSFLDA